SKIFLIPSRVGYFWGNFIVRTDIIISSFHSREKRRIRNQRLRRTVGRNSKPLCFSFLRHNAKSKNLSRNAIGKANGRHKKKVLDKPVLYRIVENFHIELETSGRLSFIGLAIGPTRARRYT